MLDAKEVTAAALALDDAERAILVQRLQDSLGEVTAADDEYEQELDRREAEVRAGTAVIRDWSEVETTIERLRERRR